MVSPTWPEFIGITLAVLGVTLTGVKVQLTHSEKSVTKDLVGVLKNVDALTTLVRTHKHLCDDGTTTTTAVFDR